MRILWITNIPIGKQCEITKTVPSSGGWISAGLELLKGDRSINICTATTWSIKEITEIKEQNIRYVVLPGGFPSTYNINKKSNINDWVQVILQFKPDIIQIWGTEFAHSLACIRNVTDIPIIVYIQGIVSQIAKQYLAGLTCNELIRSLSVRDIVKRDSIKQQQNKFYKRALNEIEILQTSQGVIVDNLWAKTHCLAINSELTIYNSQLPINRKFYETDWNFPDIEKYSIMCSSGMYPLKGMHILLKAISLIKKKYPQVKLYIPGISNIKNLTIKQKVFNIGYINFLSKQLKDLRLENNVSFLGVLTPDQMALKMKNCHVFVVPSALENHSSTLREAMIIGMPSVSSYIGGVSEIIENGENGFIYRFEEYEMIAFYVTEIFTSVELALKLSINAKKSLRSKYDPKSLNNDYLNIYKSILDES